MYNQPQPGTSVKRKYPENAHSHERQKKRQRTDGPPAVRPGSHPRLAHHQSRQIHNRQPQRNVPTHPQYRQPIRPNSRPQVRPKVPGNNHQMPQRESLASYKEKVIRSKKIELEKIKKHLKTFTKEKTWLEERKPYHQFDLFGQFHGHRSLKELQRQKNQQKDAAVFNKDLRKPHPAEGMVDLTDAGICSRYRLGIAPVFGDNLIFETPLASLAMSTTSVPDSLPEIEDLETRKLELESDLADLQEVIGRRIEPAPEPPRPKTQWDCLLEEMKLMAEDFVREDKWKQSQAKKMATAVMKYFSKEETKKKNIEKIERLRLRKLANQISKGVLNMWSKLGKVQKIGEDIDHRLEELKKSNEKLDEFVKETEVYAANLKKTSTDSTEDEMDIEGNNPDKDSLKESMKKMNDMVNSSKVDLSKEVERTPIPGLLRFGTLRDYQHVGLHWLASLHRNKTNGILADEMGLGKTIQTIALLAHLAEVEEVWGPHLIVVPSSVIMNWEMEFKRWLPGFKVMSYHGTKKERDEKRLGWSRDNAFHVCITSYNLVVREAKNFKRMRWQYLVLDEAHQIKNFESKRWQTLLNFNTQDRLLLTGTPLQNNLNELWALLHFLMPNVFESQSEFQEWFDDPVNGMIARNQKLGNSAIIGRLHQILKPFLLRRQKKDVEKQLPDKKFHIVKCRLSRRQRRLYEDFMSADKTKATMSKNDYLGMMNIVMQLRKVCNHPDLFEGRAIRAPLIVESLRYHIPSLVAQDTISEDLNTSTPLVFGDNPPSIIRRAAELETKKSTISTIKQTAADRCPFPGFLAKFQAELRKDRKRVREALAEINSRRCKELGHQIADAYHAVKFRRLNSAPHVVAREKRLLIDNSIVPNEEGVYSTMDRIPTNAYLNLVKLPDQRAKEMHPIICKFIDYHPPVSTTQIEIHSYDPPLAKWERQHRKTRNIHQTFDQHTRLLYPAQLRRKVNFPEKRLIQWDCGKLQELDRLLRRLKSGGHRVLIFTQMSKMLNVLESFLNLHQYRYLRLDGSTKVVDRGKLMHRFNEDETIFCFILSTRSGGLGMNLTGADTVIFYDNDWNPAMDMQAQDRCHRIGQTREVHIYKLMSENTIEENILKKAEQKREIMSAVMGDGPSGQDIFRGLDPWELLGLEAKEEIDAKEVKKAMALAEDEEDRAAASAAWREAQLKVEDELMCDEFREKARWNQTIQLLNPVEKYALSFFGGDRRPDPTIVQIEQWRFQCRQLEIRLTKHMRLLRELTYYRKNQELTQNADTEIELKNTNHIAGVHFDDVLKMAEINFKHQGFERGEVSLLVSDENVRDWGLFATHKDITLMLPRVRAPKRPRPKPIDHSGSIIKRVRREDTMQRIIRVDKTSLNIHIPWSLLPFVKQPQFSKPKSNLQRTKVTEQRKQLKPERPRRPKKSEPLPFNKNEEHWIAANDKADPKFISLKMNVRPEFKYKRRSAQLIQRKVSQPKNGFSRKKAEAYDLLSHEALKHVAEDKKKMQEVHMQQVTRLKQGHKNKQNHPPPLFENFIQKIKVRSQHHQQNLTPKTILHQLLQNEELRRNHVMNLERSRLLQNRLVRHGQMGMGNYPQPMMDPRNRQQLLMMQHLQQRGAYANMAAQHSRYLQSMQQRQHHSQQAHAQQQRQQTQG